MNLDHILHLLGEEELPYGSMVPPIVQSSNFSVPNISTLRSYFSNEWDHHLYTRGNNPTVAILRRKLAALENTEDAICFSSGIAAISAAVMSVVKSGDHVICVQNPYSWTYHLLANYLPKYGVQTTFVDGTNMSDIKQALKENTKLLMLESPNSMTFELQNLVACADWAKKNNITTIIDNSYCSPLFQKPSDMGIDIVIHSGSKYLNGHSDVVCGVVCSSKNRILKIVQDEMMTLGAIMSPFEAFLVLRGLRTLEVRLKHIHASTQRVFAFLKNHSLVEKIFFPFDPDNPQYHLAMEQMKGSPGLLSLQLAVRDPEQVERFVHALKKFRIGVSWGGHESLVMPILAAHFIEGKKSPVLPWNHIRLYIGLESPAALINDLEKAFDALRS